LTVSYLGVWDTVGALGIPASFEWLSWANKKHRFHDTNLSHFVKSARHAVAIDERRRDFVPTLWTNLGQLNERSGFRGEPGDAPYQQLWFPGTHGSVGGGGERRGLSDQALDWVLDGARKAGLALDHSSYSRIFELKPNFADFLKNSDNNGAIYQMMNKFSAADRRPGPASIDEVSLSTKRRWKADPETLADLRQYRPPTLGKIANQLDGLALIGTDPQSLETKSDFDLYEVKPNDALRKIAIDRLGDANKAQLIFEANRDKLESPNRIYVGQILRIPKPVASITNDGDTKVNPAKE
jgi:hypothetical protein